MIFILDAYNVIHKIPILEKELDHGLLAAREALTERCAALAKSRGDLSLIYLVFDGKSQFCSLPQKNPDKIKIVFSESGESADDRIFRLLEELSGREERRVVSDDNSVINHARVHGVKSMRVKEFESLLRKYGQMGTRSSRTDQHRAPICKEGQQPELDPEIEKEINEEYGRELGL